MTPSQLAAIKAFEQFSGTNCISAYFTSRTFDTQVPNNFNPHENTIAWQAYRYPDQFRFIKGNTSVEDLYVDYKDKHSWVLADEVEKIRAYYLNLAKENHDGQHP